MTGAKDREYAKNINERTNNICSVHISSSSYRFVHSHSKKLHWSDVDDPGEVWMGL